MTGSLFEERVAIALLVADFAAWGFAVLDAPVLPLEELVRLLGEREATSVSESVHVIPASSLSHRSSPDEIDSP